MAGTFCFILLWGSIIAGVRVTDEARTREKNEPSIIFRRFNRQSEVNVTFCPGKNELVGILIRSVAPHVRSRLRNNQVRFVKSADLKQDFSGYYRLFTSCMKSR